MQVANMDVFIVMPETCMNTGVTAQGWILNERSLVKKNAPQLLRKFLMHPKWDATPIMLSGNTDCYQPAEQKYQINTRVARSVQ